MTTTKMFWSRAAVATALAAGGFTLLTAGAVRAQVVPPSPFEFVSQLDFECHPATGMVPPPVPQVAIRQLNPVLVDKIPVQVAALGELEQVCVPVAKNGQVPSPRALAIGEFTDVACYKATTPAPVDVDLKLSHLNPVLAGLPDEFVKMTRLEQLCVPVRKNAAQLPPAVSQVVRHFDVACYQLEEPTSSADRPLVLTHLNPVIQAMGFGPRGVEMKRARQLCVPVGKNNQPIPEGPSDLVRFADFLKYRIELVAGVVPAFPLMLTHLNPLFAGAPPFPTVLTNNPLHLMVPVAKNDQLPPGGGPGAGH